MRIKKIRDCINCGPIETWFICRGMCTSCYKKWYTKIHPSSRKAKDGVNRRVLKWRSKNSRRSEHQKYYQAHKEEIRAYHREYARKNPGIRAKSWLNYRARKHEAFVDDVNRSLVFERGTGICYLCGLEADPSNWHLEHKIPLSKGGLHSYDNVGIAHPLCNLAKGSK